MQTRFQIREIDLSKGYCLLVTDKNHTRVTFGFDQLEEQIAAARTISRLLPTIRSTRSKRSICWCSGTSRSPSRKPPAEVINDTIDPEETPRIMKAIPVHPPASASRKRKISAAGIGENTQTDRHLSGAKSNATQQKKETNRKWLVTI